jgi:hypothetical protein
MSVRSGAAAFDTVALETSQTTSTQTTNLCNVDNSVPGGVGVCAERSHCWHHGTKHVGSRASAPSHVTRFLVSVEERHSSLTSVLTSIGTHHCHPFAQPFTSTVREGVCVGGAGQPTCRRRHRAIAARQSIRRDHSVAGRGRGGGCEKQRNGHRSNVALSASWQYERSYVWQYCCSFYVKARRCGCVTLWAKRSDGAGLTLSSNMRCERPAAASSPSIVVCHRGVCAH